VSSLHSCDPLAYSDNERAKQLMYDSVCGMKITALEEFADFATLDTEKFLASLNLMDCLVNVILTMMPPFLVKF
jgi:hypothetical protein